MARFRKGAQTGLDDGLVDAVVLRVAEAVLLDPPGLGVVVNQVDEPSVRLRGDAAEAEAAPSTKIANDNKIDW